MVCSSSICNWFEERVEDLRFSPLILPEVPSCTFVPFVVEDCHEGNTAGLGAGFRRAGHSLLCAHNGFSLHANAFDSRSCDLNHNFAYQCSKSAVKCASDSPASLRCEAGVTHKVLAPRSFRWRLCMEDRAPVVSPTEQSSTTTTSIKHEGRGAWVLTAYGLSGLALFGVLAYFFSDFISH